MKRSTQLQRTYQELKKAGAKGIHSFDLIKKVGSWKALARVADMRKEGMNIVSIHEKKGHSYGVRYFLNE